MNPKHCVGCRDDFYNLGKNPYGIKECWMLKNAELILRREIHVDAIPPHHQKPQRLPDCFRRPRHVYQNIEQARRDR